MRSTRLPKWLSGSVDNTTGDRETSTNQGYTGDRYYNLQPTKVILEYRENLQPTKVILEGRYYNLQPTKVILEDRYYNLQPTKVILEDRENLQPTHPCR